MRFRASMAFCPMFRNGTWGRGRSHRDINQDTYLGFPFRCSLTPNGCGADAPAAATAGSPLPD